MKYVYMSTQRVSGGSASFKVGLSAY